MYGGLRRRRPRQIAILANEPLRNAGRRLTRAGNSCARRRNNLNRNRVNELIWSIVIQQARLLVPRRCPANFNRPRTPLGKSSFSPPVSAPWQRRRAPIRPAWGGLRTMDQSIGSGMRGILLRHRTPAERARGPRQRGQDRGVRLGRAQMRAAVDRHRSADRSSTGYSQSSHQIGNLHKSSGNPTALAVRQ